MHRIALDLLQSYTQNLMDRTGGVVVAAYPAETETHSPGTARLEITALCDFASVMLDATGLFFHADGVRLILPVTAGPHPSVQDPVIVSDRGVFLQDSNEPSFPHGQFAVSLPRAEGFAFFFFRSPQIMGRILDFIEKTLISEFSVTQEAAQRACGVLGERMREAWKGFI